MPTTTTRAQRETPVHKPAASVEGGCPIAPVIDIVFSRWTTPILWQLNTYGRQRFNDLKDLAGGVTAKVLTQRLRQLERDGLVARFAYSEIPPRVEYEITALGASLAPVFAALVTWSTAHLDNVNTSRHTYDASGKPRP